MQMGSFDATLCFALDIIHHHFPRPPGITKDDAASTLHLSILSLFPTFFELLDTLLSLLSQV